MTSTDIQITFAHLRLPVIASPLFIISVPQLVIAQCKAGIVGSMPRSTRGPPRYWTSGWPRSPKRWPPTTAPAPRPRPPPAINQIVHKSNDRLEHDLAMCEKYKVPLIITSLGARPELNQAVHAWGGLVLHDVINNTFAHKAVDKGADGLIAVAAGAGGHAGTKNPLALIQEIRAWFDGPLALSGAIATGNAILAAQAMGADLAYIGSAFIATEGARADEAYKRMIVECSSDDIVYSDLFTGVHGNYLKPSIRAAGLDPDALPSSSPNAMNFGSTRKPWKDIWGCGQGIAAVRAVESAAAKVGRLAQEYGAARHNLLARAT